MKFHKEGFLIMATALLLLSFIQGINLFLYRRFQLLWLFVLLTFGVLVFAYLVIQFFRYPQRRIVALENDVLCPADGEVVVIEEVVEPEYFKDTRIQISIFMSPLNVHVNFNPIAGKIKYVKYHPGKFLVAWHPKSSTKNERSTVVIEHASGVEVLFRQIAGAVARRIVCHAKEDELVKAGEEFGMIKFGSRVDVFLPLNTTINVKIGDKVKAIYTHLAEIN
jgi:phosphatidylserine decarboxylase